MTDKQKKAIEEVLCLVCSHEINVDSAFTIIEGVLDEKQLIQYVPYKEPDPYTPVTWETTCASANIDNNVEVE